MSGDNLLIRNFVVSIDSANNTQIDIFAFVEDTWHKSKSVRVDHFESKESLASYNNWKKGYNHDDIIISKVENGKMIESEFYLTGALLSSSPFKKVIEAYYIK